MTASVAFEITNGTFYAQWEGNWYPAKTKDELSAQIKAAAEDVKAAAQDVHAAVEPSWRMQPAWSGGPERYKAGAVGAAGVAAAGGLLFWLLR